MVLVSVSSCDNYLDVEPKDKILGTQVFSNEIGVQNAHNGLYIQLADNALYGQQLSMDAVEILGQQYNISSSHNKNTINSYSYADARNKALFNSIWQSGYITILNSNKFIESLDNSSALVTGEKAKILKGEAVGIRAMVHFDLLRLFGPIFSVSPANPSIPYYDTVVNKANPILPANELIAKVLADIELSLSLLENDPVLQQGNAATSTLLDGNPYYASRGLRLNYLAVKCLKARVLLYAGDKQGAAVVANEVISFNNTSAFFPWTTFGAATDATNPDRVFSSECVFALSDYALYTKQTSLFDSSLGDDAIYAPLLSRLTAVFESNDNDYRSLPSWRVPATGGKTQKTFFKYEDIIDKTKKFRFQIPLFKISEMYLIAAETASTPAESISLLNTLRFNRGLVNLAPTAIVPTEVLKEYRKEFIGEGQLFFCYKRTNTTAIPNGATSSGNLTMDASKYVVPLPDSEINFN